MIKEVALNDGNRFEHIVTIPNFYPSQFRYRVIGYGRSAEEARDAALDSMRNLSYQIIEYLKNDRNL